MPWARNPCHPVASSSMDFSNAERKARAPTGTPQRRPATSRRGAEVSELAIVLAVLVAGCVAILALIGPKIVTFYGTVNAPLP